MSLTSELVERVSELEFSDLTGEDLTATRALLLDHIGVAANGATTDSGRSMQAFATATDSTEAPIVGTSLTAEPLRAAMANAVAAHSIEYDDVHNAASSHPGVVVFPAAIAAAEMADADAESMILGAVVGYEVMCRVGRAANPPAHYARHFHPTGTTGHFGAAAAAASIFGPILPGGKWPALCSAWISLSVTRSRYFCCGVPKLMATLGVAVRIIISSMPITLAMSADVRSLSITAETPWRTPSGPRTTGIPPPPPAITTDPLLASCSTSDMSQ